ncbi:gas vesicle protein [Usitatibacter palustris]|uniref:Gas vesicle structural protein n=1 Tax=Usitatibacter palustris TaxID=2732487 RepID=A0A6M4HCN4_9PROT|nr:gas vesicle protein [Usitatibacter palustris]QJR16284.1 Gas vesicle structural protein [Usitatibacter palustris]
MHQLGTPPRQAASTVPCDPPSRRVHPGAASLVDVLELVLDKGLVIAGDIKVSLADIELLTLRIRLIVCSIDKAEQIGLDWWKHDRHFSPGRAPVSRKDAALRKQPRALTRPVAALERRPARARPPSRASKSSLST